MSTYALSTPLANILRRQPSDLQSKLGQGGVYPQRYYFPRPEDNGTFILPLKQSFMKDARLMPGTRCMLALLAGWAGQGGPLELTQGTIARHIGRSIRQVYRYLQDAMREGYIQYSYTKNRLGMITGLKIWLGFDLIRSEKRKHRPKKPEIPGQTHMSEINNNYIYKDKKLSQKLDRLRTYIEQSPR